MVKNRKSTEIKIVAPRSCCHLRRHWPRRLSRSFCGLYRWWLADRVVAAAVWIATCITISRINIVTVLTIPSGIAITPVIIPAVLTSKRARRITWAAEVALM